MSYLIFIAGLLVGFLAKYLWDAKQEKKLQFKWWHYLLMLIWVGWTGFGVMFVAISLAEYESRAAGLASVIFGGVAILGIIGLRILYIKQKDTVRKPETTTAA